MLSTMVLVLFVYYKGLVRTIQTGEFISSNLFELVRSELKWRGLLLSWSLSGRWVWCGSEVNFTQQFYRHCYRAGVARLNSTRL